MVKIREMRSNIIIIGLLFVLRNRDSANCAARLKIPTACSMCQCDFVIRSTEKKKYDAKEGDIFIFTGYEYHDLIVTSENLDFTVADFAPKFVWSLGNERFDFLFLEPFFNRDENFENKFNNEELFG